MSKLSMIGKTVWDDINYDHGVGDIKDQQFKSKSYNTISIEPNYSKWEWGERVKREIPELIKHTTFILKDNIDYSSSSNWASNDIYQNIVGNIPALGDLMTLGGVGEGPGSVHRSKQYWVNSDYISINPQVRFIDWDGIGGCEKMAMMLMIYSNPIFSTDLIGEISAMFGGVSDSIVGKTLGRVVDSTISAGNAAFDFVDEKTSNSDSAIIGGVGNIANDIREAISDNTTLRNSPPVLKVRMGSIFFHEEMILKSFNITFSKEMTKNGPLYADVSLELQSRKVVRDVFDTGLRVKPPISRVVMNSNINPTPEEQAIDPNVNVANKEDLIQRRAFLQQNMGRVGNPGNLARYQLQIDNLTRLINGMG